MKQAGTLKLRMTLTATELGNDFSQEINPEQSGCAADIRWDDAETSQLIPNRVGLRSSAQISALTDNECSTAATVADTSLRLPAAR